MASKADMFVGANRGEIVAVHVQSKQGEASIEQDACPRADAAARQTSTPAFRIREYSPDQHAILRARGFLGLEEEPLSVGHEPDFAATDPAAGDFAKPGVVDVVA